VEERVRHDHPEIGPVEITPNVVTGGMESVENVNHFSEETAWRDPDDLVRQVRVPRPTGYSYPGQDANPADRHTYMSRLDAVLTEAAFMEHEETREEWEKHAILCERGFTTDSGTTVKASEMHMDEDITQSYEGDGSLRLGTLDGKVELIFHHPAHSGLPPVQIFEFECDNCKNQDGSGGSQSLGRRFKSGESLKFKPKADAEVPLEGTGLAQLAAPGLFSYSFNFDRSTGSGDASIHPGASAKGVDIQVEQTDGKITRIKVSGRSWESSSPDTMTPEEHHYHCQAATLNRHRKKISITTPHANIPVFPNMLGDFEVEALEHDESTEDAQFLKVSIAACGPCLHTVSVFNDNAYGLQEVSSNGYPCGKKSDDQCPPSASKSSYGTWYFTTKKFESEVKPMLDVVEAEMEMSRVNASSELSHETYWDLQELVARIRDQEVKFPFNHKMERMALKLYKCTIGVGNRVSCGSPTETRYTHDAMLMRESGEKMMIEYLKASPSDKAPPYGPLEPVGTTAGLSFDAYSAALKGGINWHLALVKYGQCTPAMQEWLFIGLGTDSNIDIDLGLIFWQKRGNTVVYHDHLNYDRNIRVKYRGAAEYSGDNRDGSGEGDDEWMALNLAALRRIHKVDYITVHVNIYSPDPIRRPPPPFSKLEGTFLRFVEVDQTAMPVKETMDPKTERKSRTRERHPIEDGKTVQYMDIDAAKGALGDATAGLMSVLFTTPDSEKALPLESTFNIPQGAHFNIVQVGKSMRAQSAHNSTSQREVMEWWQGLTTTTLREKESQMNAIDAYELGQSTREAELLQQLPGGRDPVTNEIALEDTRDPLLTPLLTPLDKELEEQSVHMAGEDKYIIEDTRKGVCMHLRQGKDLQPELFMDAHCGVGGNAIEWKLQMGESGGVIPQGDVGKCMIPSSTGAGVVLSPECEDEWNFRPVHGARGAYHLIHMRTNQCLGYTDRPEHPHDGSPPPAWPVDIVMTDCSNTANLAVLHKMLAIRGLFDNLLVEFPGGPPGTESLCLKNA
jgi:stress response protein SCP2